MRWLLTCCFCVVMLWAIPASAEFSVRYQLDSRGFNTLGLWLDRELNQNLSFWGFTDLHGKEKHDRWEIQESFSEYRLRYDPLDWFRFEAEVNIFSPHDGDVIRLGGALPLAWIFSPSLPGEWWLRGFPLQSDGGQEVSLEWYIPVHPRIAYLGFFDIDFRHGRYHIVAEPAVMIRLTDWLSLLAELRYNQFEEWISQRSGFGVAGGVVMTLW